MVIDKFVPNAANGKTVEDQVVDHLVSTYALTLDEARLIIREHGTDPDRMNGIAGSMKARRRK